MAPTILSLCSGYGGLELATRAVWPGATVVGYCEREAYSASLLLARMEDSSLEPAPIWCGNLEELPTTPFLGVDVVTAGFPCQPWSSAGKRAGTNDKRWIWPAIFNIIRDVRPRIVFLENVPGLVSGGGLPLVLGDLAQDGFDAEWTRLRASDVGAPHKRERVFILAYRNSGSQGALRHDQHNSSYRVEPAGRSKSLAYTNDPRVLTSGSNREQQRLTPIDFGWERQSLSFLNGQSGVVADTSGTGRPEDGGSTPSHEGTDAGRTTYSDYIADGNVQSVFPPGPDDRDAWAKLPPGAQPALRRDDDGVADWLGTAYASIDDQLRTLGNGVVPLQAAAALQILLERAES